MDPMRLNSGHACMCSESVLCEFNGPHVIGIKIVLEDGVQTIDNIMLTS